MVATTPIYGLPYMEGTDPPCFGTDCDNLESVFCDFAQIVEAQLDENDATIGRTAASIPMAMLKIASPVSLFSVLDTIPFDTVVFDTDNIATPVTDPTFGATFQLTPQRDGIYQIDFYVELRDDPPTSGSVPAGLPDRLDLIIGTDRFGIFGEMAVGLNFRTSSGPSQNFLRASTLYAFTGTQPIPRALSIQYQTPGFSEQIIQHASLAVYWHSDL